MKSSKLLAPQSPVERYFSLHYAAHCARLVRPPREATLEKSATAPSVSSDPSQPERSTLQSASLKAASNETVPKLTPFSSTPPLGYDTCVARHHNGLCLVCLSPQHPALKQKITNVTYRVPFLAVSGKRKKGGLKVEKLTKLCTLTTQTGQTYAVQMGVKGIIVEYNDRLNEIPSLVSSAPLREGYLAAILPYSAHMRTAVDNLITHEEYKANFE